MEKKNLTLISDRRKGDRRKTVGQLPDAELSIKIKKLQNLISCIRFLGEVLKKGYSPGGDFCRNIMYGSARYNRHDVFDQIIQFSAEAEKEVAILAQASIK
jgi:hypothetical protein